MPPFSFTSASSTDMAGTRRPSGLLGNVSHSLPFSSPEAHVGLPISGHASESISSLSHTTKSSGHLRGPSHSGAGAYAHVDANDDKEADYVAVTDVADRNHVPDKMSRDSRKRDDIIDCHRRAFMERAFPPDVDVSHEENAKKKRRQFWCVGLSGSLTISSMLSRIGK